MGRGISWWKKSSPHLPIHRNAACRPFNETVLKATSIETGFFFRANIGAEKENVIFTARQRLAEMNIFSKENWMALKSELEKPWRQGLTHLGNFGSYTPLKNAALRVFIHFHPSFFLFLNLGSEFRPHREGREGAKPIPITALRSFGIFRIIVMNSSKSIFPRPGWAKEPRKT